jgi:hypothetical protein
MKFFKFNKSRNEEITKEQLYYIQSTKKGFVGNNVVWWGKNCCGYTCHLDNAGKYTYNQAIEICGDEKESKMHKIEEVENIATLQVDTQLLRNG